MLVCSTSTRLPLRIVTLIFPADSLFSLPPTVSFEAEHRRVDLACEHTLETLHIGDENIVVERRLRQNPQQRRVYF
jgi:hypothetical protein